MTMRQPERLYSASEAARALRCSEWWLKEQARRRRIPFLMLGGSYRFTDSHLAEILATFEVRPAVSHAPQWSPRGRRPAVAPEPSASRRTPSRPAASTEGAAHRRSAAGCVRRGIPKWVTPRSAATTGAVDTRSRQASTELLAIPTA